MTPELFSSMVKDLSDFYSEDEAVQFMRSEQKLLGGRRPVDCPPQEVWRLIDQLRSGAFL